MIEEPIVGDDSRSKIPQADSVYGWLIKFEILGLVMGIPVNFALDSLEPDLFCVRFHACGGLAMGERKWI